MCLAQVWDLECTFHRTIYRVTFFTDPAQTSSKYDPGPGSDLDFHFFSRDFCHLRSSSNTSENSHPVECAFEDISILKVNPSRKYLIEMLLI